MGCRACAAAGCWLDCRGLPPLGQLRIQIVSPPLHHGRTLLEILRVVVGGGDLIPARVGYSPSAIIFSLPLNSYRYRQSFVPLGAIRRHSPWASVSLYGFAAGLAVSIPRTVKGIV